MGSIWLLGFIGIILYRAFYAGMKSKTLFYRESPYYGDNGKIIFNDNAAFSYAMWTFCAGFTWPISLPLIGIFMLGKRYQKEA